MKIYTSITFDIATGAVLESSSYEYDGPVELCCGASSQQTDTYNQQSAFSKQVQQQASAVFGNDSKVFGDLMSSFAPTVAAGPNQEGFSAGEKANLQSQAITNGGIAYRNAKAAVGNAESAQGGGNTGLTAGANIGRDSQLAESASENTAGQLNTINENDYATGRQNYDFAAQGLAGSTNTFNSASQFDGNENSALTGQGNTANQIASQNNSWVQAVTGALGGIAGGVVTGGMSNLGKGKGFFGGSGG